MEYENASITFLHTFVGQGQWEVMGPKPRLNAFYS